MSKLQNEIDYHVSFHIVNYQLCKKRTHVLQHTLKNLVEHCPVRLESFKPVIGTFMQYLLDGYTFIIRIQCSVLEVL